MPTTVGQFTFDAETSSISGPADYMRSDDYRRTIESIEAGTNHVFRAGCEFSPTIEIALLVTIQTNYAGWAGAQQFHARREAGLIPETGEAPGLFAECNGCDAPIERPNAAGLCDACRA